MMGTGFIKCIPITFFGLCVTDAILVMEIDEVFVANIVLASHNVSSSLKIFNLIATFSVAASITKSVFLTPVSYTHLTLPTILRVTDLLSTQYL